MHCGWKGSKVFAKSKYVGMARSQSMASRHQRRRYNNFHTQGQSCTKLSVIRNQQSTHSKGQPQPLTTGCLLSYFERFISHSLYRIKNLSRPVTQKKVSVTLCINMSVFYRGCGSGSRTKSDATPWPYVSLQVPHTSFDLHQIKYHEYWSDT